MIKHRIKVYSTLGQRSSIPTTSRRSLLNMKDVSLCILNFNRFLYTSLVCVCKFESNDVIPQLFFDPILFFCCSSYTCLENGHFYLQFRGLTTSFFFSSKTSLEPFFFFLIFFLGTELETSKVCTRQPRNRFSHNQNVDSTTAKERERESSEFGRSIITIADNTAFRSFYFLGCLALDIPRHYGLSLPMCGFYREAANLNEKNEGLNKSISCYAKPYLALWLRALLQF